jgi:two-component system KDP operon response regulator KdpE
MTAERTVLVIDDEPPIRRLLRLTLEPQGYRVFEADNGQLGLQEAAARRPDVIVLDLGLPDMDGLTVLKRLREWSQTPVLVLSVRDREADKVAALDNGADDYLTKPFGTGELLARMRAVQRRTPDAQEEPVFMSGDLTVDLAGRTVTVKKKEVHLTATEYALLRELVRHAGKAELRGPVAVSARVHHALAQEVGDQHEREVDPDGAGHWVSVAGE